MTATDRETDLELIESLDFEPSLQCEVVWGKSGKPCPREAEWVVTWLCGCRVVYCSPCCAMKENSEKQDKVRCEKHGYKIGQNKIVSTEPIKGERS
jgi:hypothetical protein